MSGKRGRPRKHAILDDYEALQKAIEEAGSQVKFSRQTGISRSAVQEALYKHRAKAEAEGKEKAVAPEPEATPEQIIAQETQAAKERARERVLNELMQERVKTEILAEKIVDAVKALEQKPLGTDAVTTASIKVDSVLVDAVTKVMAYPLPALAE